MTLNLAHRSFNVIHFGRNPKTMSRADPENCFGRGTLDLSRRRRQSERNAEGVEGERSGEGVLGFGVAS